MLQGQAPHMPYPESLLRLYEQPSLVEKLDCSNLYGMVHMWSICSEAITQSYKNCNIRPIVFELKKIFLRALQIMTEQYCS